MSKPIHVSRAMPHSGEFTCPVPVHEDSGLTVIKSQVPCSKLLIAKEGSVLAAVECQVGHEAARSIVHEDTLLSVGSSSVGAHVEDNVLEGSCLSDLPVDTGTCSNRHSRGVDDEVANLAEEVVLVRVPVYASISIRIAVNQSNASKASSSLDGWDRDGITNELGIVKLDKGRAD